MARKFTGVDVHNWKVVTFAGKVLRYPPGSSKAGKPMTDLSGFSDANAFASRVGGVAVRV